jgi:hypothetical protein
VTGSAPARPPAAPQTAAQPQQQAAQKAATGQQTAAPQGTLARRYAARPKGADGAGAVLALFAYPLLINALKGGPAQAKGWVAAKFINQPYGGPGPGGPGSKTITTRNPPPQRPGPGPRPHP